MPRHFLSLTAATAALALTLTGCGGSSGPDEVTLSLIAADYDVSGGQSSKTYWSKLVREFESQHTNIKVEVRIEPWTDVDREVSELVKEGKAPDMAQIGAYADYAADDKLYSADELLSIPVQSNFLPPLADAGEQRRVQYGLPFAASTRLLFYNKDLFAEAGIEKAPKTWAELSEAAERLKSGTDVKYPFALPLGPEEAQIETMMWLLGSGSNGYVDPGGGYSIDTEENAGTLQWIKSHLVGPGLTGPGAPGELNRKDAFAAFTRGEVGMLNGHPSLIKQARAAGVGLGMVPVPGRTGETKASLGVADWIMGFKENGNKDEIGTFLDFLFADKNVLAFASQNDLLPVTVTGSEAMELDPDHRDLRQFLRELPAALLPPVDKTSWGAVSDDIKRNIGKAVTEGTTPEKVLGRIARNAAEAEAKEE
ncbi:extracellular solute-binding protein [Streptomyces sp. NPDC001985]|uniref:extracellular solute-binding protein n=1 Tax=Streptomyces sp. NPDC001985 TaxID=3154406 RepID=UPI00332ACE16